MRKCISIGVFIVLLGMGMAAYGMLPYTDGVCGSGRRSATSEPPSTMVTTHLDVEDSDDGVVSLREAMLYAMSDPTLGRHITFALPYGSPRTIELESMLPVLNGDTLAIDGGGICISGGNTNQIFQMENHSSLTLENLVLAHGYAVGGKGGAICCNSGTLTVDHCRLVGNRAAAVGTVAGYGGAVYMGNATRLTLRNSMLDSNAVVVAAGAAMGVHTFGGALALPFPSDVVIENCRFEGNTAERGGAIYGQSPTAIEV